MNASSQLITHLTKQDYSKFRQYAMVRLRKTWLLSIPFAGLFAWTAFPKDYAEYGISFTFALVAASFIGIVVSGIIFLISIATTSLLPNKPGTVLGEHTFTLTDSEFQETNAAGSASVKLELLRRYETAQHVFLLTPTHVGYILPMRDLQTNPEFLRVLRERTKQAA